MNTHEATEAKILRSKPPKHYITISGIFQIALNFLVIAAIIAALAGYYVAAHSAKDVLRQARLVRLAFNTVSKTFRADSLALTDENHPSGVSVRAREEIEKLVECEGEFFVLSIDPQTLEVSHLLYRQGSFTAEIIVSGGNGSMEAKVTYNFPFVGN